MKSFKQMRIDGEITRADAEKIQYKDLYLEPGFNPPGRTEGDDADDESLFEYIKGGGRIPDLEVRPREGGGVWIVDGHRRHKQIGRAIASGDFLPDPKSGKFLIPIKQFIGNDVDRVVRIATSNEGKKLSPLDVAYIYKKLTGFGLSPDDIAKRMHKTRAHVEQILVLASANHDVHRMVNAGEVSASLAAQVVRKNGERAGEVLGAALTKAKGSGKSKVTAATIKTKKDDKGAQGHIAIPDGWQIVPKEPTPEMCAAGQEAGKNFQWSYAACYKAMLAACEKGGASK